VIQYDLSGLYCWSTKIHIQKGVEKIMKITSGIKTSLKKIMMVSLSAVVIMVMSGCSGNNTNNASNADNVNNANSANSNNNTKTNDVLQTDFSNTATVKLQPTEGGTAAGEATITYNEETKVMSVEVEATGLEPDSEHLQHLHSGTCEEYGDVIHPLDTLKADGDGEASSTNTFQDVEKFDVANMVLNIHQGADLEGDNANQISCGIVQASE
jgi:Tfp pilus assembly protein PilW